MLIPTYAMIPLEAIRIPKILLSSIDLSLTIQPRATMEHVFIWSITVLATGLAPLMINNWEMLIAHAHKPLC